MAKKQALRSLRLGSLDELLAEAKRLLESGYQMDGNWNLAQACLHISDWLRFPIDGYPKMNFVMSGMMRLARWLYGRRLAKRLLAGEPFPAGNPTVPETVAQPDAFQDEQAVARLEEVIQRFQAHDGPWFESPFFGPLEKADLEKVHTAHGALHLSFLRPKD